jgi:hypothetical protein
LRLSSASPFQYPSLPSCSSVRVIRLCFRIFYIAGGWSIFGIYRFYTLPLFIRPSSRYFVTLWRSLPS